MLEGLYEVDWENLTHAYGSASDVPGMILSLASTEQEERTYGFQLLEQNLCIQGALYEASAYTITYLNQLLQHPLFEEKPRLLELLAKVANGQAPLDVLKSVGSVNIDETDPEIQLRLTLERAWAKMANEAVLESRVIYLQLLSHFDPEVRISAAYLLSHLPGQGDQLIETMARRLKAEHEPLIKANLLFAIGRQDNAFEKLGIKVGRFLDSGSHPLLRLAVLMSITRSHRRDTPKIVLMGLIDLLSAYNPSLPFDYAALPWAEGHLYADIALCLCHFGRETGSEILPDLIRVLDRVDPKSSISIAYAMLYLGISEGQPYKELSNLELALLSAIAGSAVLWEESAAASRLLSMFNLPDTKQLLHEFLN